MTLLLDGIRVVDAASFLAGPGAATVLGDFGADVVKVEPPGGDGYRTLSRPHPTDYNWLLTSRNKRSIAIDLTHGDGPGVLGRLVDGADVLVVNFFDDQLERYGLDYETVRARNPRLVYARMSAYGTEGPEARTRGFDSTAWWARTGLMDLVRDKDQPPVMGAPGFGDHSSAMSLFGAIMLGLYRRERTGEGCCVESSLMANGVWANGMQLQGRAAGFDLSALKQEKGLLNPFTAVYRTSDDRYLLFAIINSVREWPRLIRALGTEAWAEDARFVDFRHIMRNRVALKDMIADIIGGWTLAEARNRLDAETITYSVVQSLPEVLEDEQARAAGIIVETGSDDPDYPLTVSSPIRMREADKRPPGPAPDVGEHGDEILEEAGFDREAIAALRAAGVLGPAGDGHAGGGNNG